MSYPKVDFGVTEKNTRPISVAAGTCWVSAVVPVERDFRPEPAWRHKAEKRGRQICLDEYEKTWGDIPWDRIEFSIAHVTSQVVVELRVQP